MVRKQDNGGCHHFNGIQNKCCEAGVEYDSLRGKDYEFRLPCLTPFAHEEGRITARCGRRRLSTADEIDEAKAKSEADLTVALTHLFAVAPLVELIKKEQKGQDWRGVLACPVCGGQLAMSHAGCNGHCAARCRSAGCVAFIE
ncbi:MAG: hypothetical protein ABI557_05740 [Aureliella sp.]